MNWCNKLRIILSSLVILLGLTVLIGWYSHNTLLIQVLPSYAPMQYNTALAFLLLGSSLLLINYRLISFFCGVIVLLIGAITLLEYLFHIQEGIDQLLMSHYITVETSQPGRMAPNTAISFTLSGILILTCWKHDKRTTNVLLIGSAIVLFLSLISLTGYVFNLPTTYGWGHLTRMAIHTSIGFIAASLSILFYVFSQHKQYKAVFMPLLPLLIIVISSLVITTLWQQSQLKEHETIKAVMSRAIDDIKKDIKKGFNNNPALLQKFVINWSQNNKHLILTEELKQSFSKIIINDYLPDLMHQYWNIHISSKNTIIYKSDTLTNHIIKQELTTTKAIQLGPMTWTITVTPTSNVLNLIFSWTPTMMFLIGLLLIFITVMLAQTGIALKKSRQQADAANKAKSNFLSNMSHEIRTPLNAIIGYTQLIEYDKKVTPHIATHAKSVLKSSKHLLALINDILDLSAIESGKVELSIETVSLNDVMAELVMLSTPLLEKNNITLNYCEGNNKNCYFKADYNRIKQILLNIISNAIKYNRPNGSVKVFLNPIENGRVTIAVRDTGYGIPEKKINKLFMPFQRLGAEKSNIEGTGIGLVICKNLIALLDGTISVESIVNEGTTVWINLPVAKKPETLIIDAKKKSDQKFIFHKNNIANHKILVVEDNPANQAIISQQLEFLEVKCDIASNGVEGLSLYRCQDYDLILMDCNMPKMDGYQLTETIRRQELTNGKHIPIVAFTANAYKEELRKCLNSGMDDHLIKPVELENLQRKLERWLNIELQDNNAEISLQSIQNQTSNQINDCIDLSIIEKYLGKDKKIHWRYFEKFLEASKENNQDLSNAYTNKDNKGIKFYAHKLKSSSKAVGATTLSQLCIDLEQEAMKNNSCEIDRIWPNYQKNYEQVIIFLQQELAGNNRSQ